MKSVALLIVLMALLSASCTTDKSMSAKSDENPGLVKAMTFNIRYGSAKDGENHWDKRKHMVFKVIQDFNPDFVGLQEALKFQIDEILKSNPRYKSTGDGRDGGMNGEFSNILYDHNKFDLIESETFWLSDTPDKVSKSWGNSLHRICSWALLKNKTTAKQIYVFNTHFDHRSVPSRIQSSRLVIEKIRERKFKEIPFILTGDFNADSASLEMNYFSSNNILDSDTFVSHEDPNRGSFSSFKYGNYKKKIDYIFIKDREWEVKKSEIIRYSENQRYPSDHFPIYAELILKDRKM